MVISKELRSYSLIALGALLVSISYNTFLLPAKLAAGGVVGISTLLFDLYNWTPAIVQWCINIPVFFLGYFLLGKELFMMELLQEWD